MDSQRLNLSLDSARLMARRFGGASITPRWIDRVGDFLWEGRRGLLVGAIMLSLTAAAVVAVPKQGVAPAIAEHELAALKLPEPDPDPEPVVLAAPVDHIAERDVIIDTVPDEPVMVTPMAEFWAPDQYQQERRPSDHLPVPTDRPVKIRVVTVRAKVTAYTPYDHADSHPQWADGIVAWHPHGKRRHVAHHRYCLATDWSQFPAGATFIRVPGYMEKTYANFPENFRVVDDACGAARKARRNGGQPIIDVRYMTMHSALSGGKNAWGSRELDVEVVFPGDMTIPSSLRRWVVKDEVRTYWAGERID